MKIRKTDRIGTIHELAIQLANISELDNINPKSTKDKNDYIKILDKLKIFPSNYTRKQKVETVSKLKLLNFNESEIIEQQSILKSINSYNRLISKARKNAEDEILAGRNVKKNTNIIKNIDKVEINIPRRIRNDLKIYDKAVKLNKYSTKATRNRINYYSGLGYDFLIKDGFNKPYYVDYDKLQKIRREGNVVEYVLNEFKKGVKAGYDRDFINFSKSDKKKWLAKQKVYNKLNKVIEHNEQIATNKKYNKKLVNRVDGKIVKDNSEYPVLMDITHEMIDIYIP